MSLATRCTACGTVFRVVRDQLRVSEGWVRCGRCQEVFNALDNLFDLEREAPPPWPRAASAAAEATVVASDGASAATSGAVDLQHEPLLHQESTLPAITENGDASLHSEPPSEHSTGFADARFPSSFMASELSPSANGDAAVASAEEAAQAEPAPEFLRRAEAREREHSRGARIAWSLASVALLLGLAAQTSYHLRDWIAALWPHTQHSLEAMCAQLGCRVEPLRRIDSVAVESSGLTRMNGVDAYKLSVVLRNRSGIPVALPSVELSLTDPQGQIVARRVLSPAELGATQRVLQPGAEVPLQTALASNEKRVLGYTVEIFYP